MWRSLFLHEFIDQRITNFQALAGTATPASLTLRPTDEVVAGVNAVSLHPGAGFEYVLATPLLGVIGISCRVRLMYPRVQFSPIFPVIRLGADAELSLRPQVDPGFHPDGGTLSHVRVRIGSPVTDIGRVELPARQFVELRFDWHTSGQARILADGRLVAYHNAVSPGASLAIDRVVFGMPNVQPPAQRPHYLLGRVFVRVLQRPDALAQFSMLLPNIKAPPDENRCRLRITSNVLTMVDQLHQFMASIHQTLSQPWSERAGPAGGPFKPEAIRAHTLARVAATELVRMLRTIDFASPDRFLDPFTEFLGILHATQPQRFAALTTELDGMTIVPDECRAVLEAVSEENQDALAPIIKLLTEASDRVRRTAGGN